MMRYKARTTNALSISALLMALSLPSMLTCPCSTRLISLPIRYNKTTSSNCLVQQNISTRCELKEPSPVSQECSKLEIGSPIIVTEAPRMLKTAASVPCLRVNSGLVKPGDVGRIVSRKPKDVWAVRLSIGTYLIDAKYFKPLELND